MKRMLVVLLAVTLAGCFDSNDAPHEQVETPASPVVPAYRELDESILSQPVHAVGPAHNTYVPGAGEIKLFVEWFLPDDSQGPWPVILHSTPYSHLDRPTGGSGYIDYYVPRGYAVAIADVRGFGESEGCVEIWGENEQRDQALLVEWIADQPWSDGQVALIGVSYPGTTPIEAAVMAPPSLTTVVAVAGLTDPYFDWHYGGVPNSEPSGSPVAYFGIGGVVPLNVQGGPDWATAAAHGRCTSPPVVAESYRMDGLYTDFYAERNLSARVDNIKVPFLYSQGFTDSNVKPSQLLHFFNEIPTVKKGFFGQWAHSNPARPDWKVHELAWFDQWMKGIDTGILEGPVVEVISNLDTWRGDTQWPPEADVLELHLDARDMSLALEPVPAGQANVQSITTSPLPLDDGSTVLTFTSRPMPRDVTLAGVPELHFTAEIDQENVFWDAAMWSDGHRVSFGMLNAALRDGYTEYEPVPAGAVDYEMDFQPREWIVQEGEVLELTFMIQDAVAATNPEANAQVHATLFTGEGQSVLRLPVLDARSDVPLPWEE